jgi:PqqD family protein of HPr-rel-A system
VRPPSAGNVTLPGVGHLGYDGDGNALAVSSVPAEYVPNKKADVLELDMGDGVILYDDASSLVHHLSPSASVIWQLCRGDASVGTLAGEIAEELHQDPDRMRTEISVLLAELDALGLVEDAPVSGGSEERSLR